MMNVVYYNCGQEITKEQIKINEKEVTKNGKSEIYIRKHINQRY